MGPKAFIWCVDIAENEIMNTHNIIHYSIHIKLCFVSLNSWTCKRKQRYGYVNYKGCFQDLNRFVRY